MCGIVGGIGTRPFAFLAAPGPLQRATDLLAHRGPDDRGEFTWPDRQAFFGHRRLSIIDLDGGQQPLQNENGQVRLVYNGEIYNHAALRTALRADGHRFRSCSDGEAALHAYEQDAQGFTSRLRGMFAIAILDAPQRRLLLCRDRLGIKPLYWWSDGESLIFASELKAILALLPKAPAISPEGLRAYLRWKYVPSPLTIYAGIHELAPATVLVAELPPAAETAAPPITPNSALGAPAALQISLSRYWSPAYSADTLRDEREALEILDQRVRDAVVSHLEADVEVGALLSGGVDSSLVVAIAARHHRTRIKTFSVGFREPGFDQLPFARTLADHCGTQHFEQLVDLDPLPTLEKLSGHFDQPFADSSAIACYAVCQVAAQHVKVALTGDGGDEPFAGYQRYAQAYAAAGRPSRGNWLRRAMLWCGANAFSPEAKFLRKLRGDLLTPRLAFLERERLCSAWLLRRLLTPAWRSPPDPRHDEAQPAEDPVYAALHDPRWRDLPDSDALQALDVHTYLPGDILTKVDRTSMACSLECRPPLLDHALIELAARLDSSLKLRAGGKYLLKKLAERYVPHELLYRKKRGFRVPIRRWFKGELLPRAATLLRHGALIERGVLDPRGVAWLMRAQRRPWINLSSCLWALLALELWARR